jgi:hypothetical protein
MGGSRPACSGAAAAWCHSIPPNWRWAASSWNLGHGRWRIKNNAFNALIQHWHLRHCAHHDPTSILACLLITLLAFNLFHAFALLKGKLYRQGKITLQELRLQLYRAVAHGWLLPLFSGSEWGPACGISGLAEESLTVGAEKLRMGTGRWP